MTFQVIVSIYVVFGNFCVYDIAGQTQLWRIHMFRVHYLLDSAPKNRFGLSVIFSFNLVQLKGIYQNFAISRAFNIAPRPLKILKDFLKDLGKKK